MTLEEMLTDAPEFVELPELTADDTIPEMPEYLELTD